MWDEAAILRQELAQVEGQKQDAEATVVSQAAEVTMGRAAHVDLERTVQELRDVVTGKCSDLSTLALCFGVFLSSSCSR